MPPRPRLTNMLAARPGEPVYSTLMRDFLRHWSPSFGIYLRSVLDTESRTTAKTLLLPKIDKLREKVPEGHAFCSADTLWAEHSAFPFLSFFATPLEKATWKSYWLSGRLLALRVQLGLNRDPALRLSPIVPRYCPVCFSGDLESAVPPLPHWRILQQLPTVFVCSIHKCDLVDGCVTCGEPDSVSSAMRLPGICACGITVNHRYARAPFDASEDVLYRLAELTQETFRLTPPVLKAGQRPFWNAVGRAAEVIGWPFSERRVAQALSETFSSSLLAHFQIAIRTVPRESVELRGGVIARSVSRLLVVSAVFGSLGRFRDALDKVSEARPVEGMGPLRNGFDLDLPQSALGPVDWQAASMLADGLPKVLIRKTLSISLYRIKWLCEVSPGLQALWRATMWERLRAGHRATYANTQCGLGGSARGRQTAADWLRVHDAEWLHSQPRRWAKPGPGRSIVGGSQRDLIAAQKRDEELESHIRSRLESRPWSRRVSTQSLIVGSRWAHRYRTCPDQFPRCQRLIAGATETHSAYVQRRMVEAHATVGPALSTLPKKVVAQLIGVTPSSIRENWEFVRSLTVENVPR